MATPGSLGRDHGDGGYHDLLHKMLDFQKQQAEDGRRLAGERKAQADKRAKLERRRQRQDSRHAWAVSVAQAASILCALLACAMLVALLNPPSTTLPNSQSWRGWKRVPTACWAPSGGTACEAWQKAYGMSAILSFVLNAAGMLLAMGVAMGWTNRLHSALLALLAGSWGASVAVMAIFWLSSTWTLAVFASACLGAFMVLGLVLLPSVLLLPLVWLYSHTPPLVRGRAKALQLEGIDCEHTGAVHWAAAAYSSRRGSVAGLCLGTLLRLLAVSEDDADRPDVVSPVFIAADRGHTKAVRILLSAGADPDSCFWGVPDGPYGGLNFPLKAAAARGHLEAVRELLRFDADPGLLDGGGRSALHIAAKHGHAAVVELLLSFGADPRAADSGDRTPLHLAAAGGHLAVTQALLRAGVEVGGGGAGSGSSKVRTPLQAAVSGGHTLVVEALLRQPGADPNCPDLDGRTLLHDAAQRGRSGMVEVLLECGANPNAADLDGRTALRDAVEEGRSEAVELLLRGGADANTPDLDGHTPLQAAVVAGDLQMVASLIGYGADVNVADCHGRTLLHAAVVGGHSQVVETLLAYGADPCRLDMDGHSPLHVAAAAGNLEVVKSFRGCERGTAPPLDPTFRNSYGTTARQVAEASGWRSVSMELAKWEVQLAMVGGPSPTRRSPPRRSPSRRSPSRMGPDGIPQVTFAELQQQFLAGLSRQGPLEGGKGTPAAPMAWEEESWAEGEGPASVAVAPREPSLWGLEDTPKAAAGVVGSLGPVEASFQAAAGGVGQAAGSSPLAVMAGVAALQGTPAPAAAGVGDSQGEDQWSTPAAALVMEMSDGGGTEWRCSPKEEHSVEGSEDYGTPLPSTGVAASPRGPRQSGSPTALAASNRHSSGSTETGSLASLSLVGT